MKRLIPCIYLYKEKAVKNFKDMTVVSENPVELAKTYCDNAADELIVFDMSKGDEEHEKALDMIKEICDSIEIPVIGKCGTDGGYQEDTLCRLRACCAEL